MREVSRVRNTKQTSSEKDGRRNYKLQAPFGKEQICLKKLPPHYVSGFIDGEGSFCISIGKNAEYARRVEVRPEFEIELRADDREILERILITIGCGQIYDLSYDRYGWFPHVKYKITSSKNLEECLFPFLDAYPLQAKKAKVYVLFKEVVLMYRRKEHLTDEGFARILVLRDQMRVMGKKQKNVPKDRNR
jgi:hypothetical protein